MNMAPDRGSRSSEMSPPRMGSQEANDDSRDDDIREVLAERASQSQNFTLRGLLVGLGIGIIVCFSNTYFGLQTGWVSGMVMPSALIGFAFFKNKYIARLLKEQFTPVENVFVQSVAGSVGVMPLGAGFVGVIPALEYLLTKEENGPVKLGLGKLILWAVGICFFGVVFAVPLRKEVIIREKLKFPSGTATALMISVLHGEKGSSKTIPSTSDNRGRSPDHHEEEGEEAEEEERLLQPGRDTESGQEGGQYSIASQDDWKAKIRLLIVSFIVSSFYTILSFFVPQVHSIPVFGSFLANEWLWKLNPSPAYVGQGIIMGPATTLHMLLGAVLGWGVLSPLARKNEWAPGPVNDWETGSKGWIVWISLGIMLADSLVNLGWLMLRPILSYGRVFAPAVWDIIRSHKMEDILKLNIHSDRGRYAALQSENSEGDTFATLKKLASKPDEEPDAPPEHLVSNWTVAIGLVLSVILSVIAVHVTFPSTIPLVLTMFALVLAMLLSIMGVRAIGETDLNPVSGISKLTQLAFALVTPTSGPYAKNGVIINLIAGAISESGALQAGDLMQDIKAGHLLGAAPNAQFWGQIIGSAVGAVVAAIVYKLYTHVYSIPGDLFQVPTAVVWVLTARLVTGTGLPTGVPQWATGAGLLWAILTVARVYGGSLKRSGRGGKWVDFVPGGIAVAVGMYNVPSFTLARAVGGVVSWYWRRYKGREETPVIVLASGLILGEGVCSIINLCLASLGVPHL